MRKRFFAYIFLVLIIVIGGCKKIDEITASNVRDISGKWVGLATDDGQLGTGGLSTFTFEITQKNTKATGKITIDRTLTTLSYTSSFNGKVGNSEGITTFEGSFDIIIEGNSVHVDFSSVLNYGQLVGFYSGTNSSLGKITGGGFVLNSK